MVIKRRSIGEVDGLDSRVSIYSGSLDDNKEMAENTTIRKEEFHQHGIKTRCFEGLTHEELVSKVDCCLPWVMECLEEDERSIDE